MKETCILYSAIKSLKESNHFNLRVKEALRRDWQNTVVNLQSEAGKADPLELVVEEEVGELELEDDVEQVEDLANVELGC